MMSHNKKKHSKNKIDKYKQINQKSNVTKIEEHKKYPRARIKTKEINSRAIERQLLKINKSR